MSCLPQCNPLLFISHSVFLRCRSIRQDLGDERRETAGEVQDTGVQVYLESGLQRGLHFYRVMGAHPGDVTCNHGHGLGQRGKERTHRRHRSGLQSGSRRI